MRHTQNLGIFRTLPNIVISDIFRHIHVLFRHIQPYGVIQNFAIFRVLACLWTKAYLELRLFSHIQTYSIMLVIIRLLTYVSYNQIFHFNLKYFKSNPRSCSVRKGFALRNFSKFTGKQLYQSLFF